MSLDSGDSVHVVIPEATIWKTLLEETKEDKAVMEKVWNNYLNAREDKHSCAWNYFLFDFTVMQPNQTFLCLISL